MGCLTGLSFTDDCAGKYPGISRIKIIPYQHINTRTPDGSDAEAWSAFTLEASEYWKNYEFEIDTAVWTETKEEGLSKRWTQEIVFDAGQLTQTVRNAIMEFVDCGCGVSVAIEDEQDKIHILEGRNRGLFLTANVATTGETGGQVSDLVTLSALSDTKARYFTGSWGDLAVS